MSSPRIEADSGALRYPLFLATTGTVLAALYLMSLRNYLVFHSLAETLTVVVASGIFMIAWNCRSFLESSYLSILGIACLFFGGVDILHMMAYKGLGVFPEAGANLPTQLWIAGRYLLSISF